MSAGGEGAPAGGGARVGGLPEIDQRPTVPSPASARPEASETQPLAGSGAPDHHPLAAAHATPLTLDAEAITALYRRHAQILLVFFQRRIHDPELAVDLVADTFELVIDRREQFRGTSDRELHGWLWRIAQSVLTAAQARELREEQHRSGLALQRRALSDVELERVEELAGTTHLRADVARHLHDLPPETQEAVRLHVVEGLTYAAVAQRLGIRSDAARTRVSRALRLLHRQLGPAIDDWQHDR
jgi:RNA polymerase sigma factor (sigma-70 family)